MNVQSFFLFFFFFFFWVGIGQGRITKNVEGAPVDYAVLVKDTDVIKMVSLV